MALKTRQVRIHTKALLDLGCPETTPPPKHAKSESVLRHCSACPSCQPAYDRPTYSNIKTSSQHLVEETKKSIDHSTDLLIGGASSGDPDEGHFCRKTRPPHDGELPTTRELSSSARRRIANWPESRPTPTSTPSRGRGHLTKASCQPPRNHHPVHEGEQPTGPDPDQCQPAPLPEGAATSRRQATNHPGEGEMQLNIHSARISTPRNADQHLVVSARSTFASNSTERRLSTSTRGPGRADSPATTHLFTNNPNPKLFSVIYYLNYSLIRAAINMVLSSSSI